MSEARSDEYKFFYYYSLRTEARSRIVNAINRSIKSHGNREAWTGITLASIDSKALEYARREWPKYYSEQTHLGFEYSWEKLYYKFLNNPAHYNIAIWQDLGDRMVLQGMALGRPSRGKTHLTINWVERSFEPTYFKGGVLLPVLACAEEYAKLLGCERVLVKDPVDPHAFAKYGYAPSKLPSVKGSYVAKELDHG